MGFLCVFCLYDTRGQYLALSEGFTLLFFMFSPLRMFSLQFIYTGGQSVSIIIPWQPSDWIASYCNAIGCTYDGFRKIIMMMLVMMISRKLLKIFFVIVTVFAKRLCVCIQWRLGLRSTIG